MIKSILPSACNCYLFPLICYMQIACSNHDCTLNTIFSTHFKQTFRIAVSLSLCLFLSLTILEFTYHGATGKRLLLARYSFYIVIDIWSVNDLISSSMVCVFFACTLTNLTVLFILGILYAHWPEDCKKGNFELWLRQDTVWFTCKWFWF